MRTVRGETIFPSHTIAEWIRIAFPMTEGCKLLDTTLSNTLHTRRRREGSPPERQFATLDAENQVSHSPLCFLSCSRPHRRLTSPRLLPFSFPRSLSFVSTAPTTSYSPAPRACPSSPHTVSACTGISTNEGPTEPSQIFHWHLQLFVYYPLCL